MNILDELTEYQISNILKDEGESSSSSIQNWKVALSSDGTSTAILLSNKLIILSNSKFITPLF